MFLEGDVTHPCGYTDENSENEFNISRAPDAISGIVRRSHLNA